MLLSEFNHLGDYELLKDNSKYVAIIGSRNATSEEIEVAFKIAKNAAEKGFIVVSGLAEGVDTAAHSGALSVEGGKTIAIVSTLPNQSIFPKSNSALAKLIVKKGCIVYPFSYSPLKNDEKSNKPLYITRLLERDLILAKVCPTIIPVYNGKIKGGTKWAVNYGVYFGANVVQFDGTGNKVELSYEKAKSFWSIETNNLLEN